MNSKDLQHPELILNQYRGNLLNKLKSTAIMLICRGILFIIYTIFLIFYRLLKFDSISITFIIFTAVTYGIVIFLIAYYMIPQMLNCKRVLKNISILKEKPLYLSKITESIFLLYKSLHGEKKKIENLESKHDKSLFISYFEKKIKEEKYFGLLIMFLLIMEISTLYYDDITIKNIVFIIVSSLFIIISLKIIKYSKSWSDSYSNLSHWNEFFSNYEITPKYKELNLLEKDFQQFEISYSNLKIICPVCKMYNDPNSNYCDNCGNELKTKGDQN